MWPWNLVGAREGHNGNPCSEAAVAELRGLPLPVVRGRGVGDLRNKQDIGGLGESGSVSVRTVPEHGEVGLWLLVIAWHHGILHAQCCVRSGDGGEERRSWRGRWRL